MRRRGLVFCCCFFFSFACGVSSSFSRFGPFGRFLRRVLRFPLCASSFACLAVCGCFGSCRHSGVLRLRGWCVWCCSWFVSWCFGVPRCFVWFWSRLLRSPVRCACSFCGGFAGCCVGVVSRSGVSCWCLAVSFLVSLFLRRRFWFVGFRCFRGCFRASCLCLASGWASSPFRVGFCFSRWRLVLLLCW